jgi:pimeloyl-ACP methyl ester carboxylesterase
MSMLEPRTVIRTSSRGIVYGRRGDGRPVVLLHGWCLNRGLWTYAEEHLRHSQQVFTPDLPGFGASSGLGGPYILERYADELLAFLDELDLRDATVVGFAFGAAVAMAAAARGAERLGRLGLIGVPSSAHGVYDRMPRAMRKDWPEFARRSAIAICKQPQSDATLAWLGAMFGATPLPVALATVGLLGSFDPTHIAARVPTRSMFIHGAQDDVVPLSVSEQCAGAMPDATVRVVPDCGHLVVLDQKERLHELLDELLAEA